DLGRGNVDEDETLDVFGDNGATVVAHCNVYGPAGKSYLGSGGLEDLVRRHHNAAVRLHADLEPIAFIGRPGQEFRQDTATQRTQQRRREERKSESHNTVSSNGSSGIGYVNALTRLDLTL